MVQRKSLSTIDGTLGPHFAAFDDVLLTGEICVRTDEDDARELAPDFIFARQVRDPESVDFLLTPEELAADRLTG